MKALVKLKSIVCAQILYAVMMNERVTCRSQLAMQQRLKKANEARRTLLILTSVLWYRDLFTIKQTRSGSC